MLFGGAVVTLVFLCVTAIRPAFLRDLDFIAYDELTAHLGAPSSDSEVVVVDVDEQSLAALGQWPWPRYRMAELIDRLSGARCIAVDVLFSEPDRLSLSEVRRVYAMDRNLDIPLDRLPHASSDNDAILAEAIAAGTVVLAADLVFTPGARDSAIACEPTLAVVERRSSGGRTPASMPSATGMTCPISPLAAAAASVAASNAVADADGTLRRLPLLLRAGDRLVPGLALAALAAAQGIDSAVVESSGAGVSRVRLGGYDIPTDVAGNLSIPFRTAPAARIAHYSASAVLAGAVGPEVFDDRIVFIGASASGLMDTHATPIASLCPGVDLHALAVDSMLRHDSLSEPGWASAAQLAAIFLVGVTLTGFLAWTPIAVGAAVAVAMLGAVCVGSWAFFVNGGVFLSPVPAAGTAMGTFALLAAGRLRLEEWRARTRMEELSLAQKCALLGLVSVVETRDPETGRHIIRTQHFVRSLAEHLASHPKFRGILSPEYIEGIFKSAPLHDTGKVAIPDAILLKPGKLTEDEFAIMKTHTERGYDILHRAEEKAGLSRADSFLRCAKEIARWHHEKWDGSGYPDGLRGEEIPVSARLMAMADVYDALRANRVYKPRMSHEDARTIILDGNGTHFDPDVVDAFLALEGRFQEILEEHKDPD